MGLIAQATAPIRNELPVFVLTGPTGVGKSDWAIRLAEQAAVEKLFPAIATWVRRYGHVEIGDQEGFGFIVRAIDYGGVVFEDSKPNSLTEAMAALEKGLEEWFEEQGIDLD